MAYSLGQLGRLARIKEYWTTMRENNFLNNSLILSGEYFHSLKFALIDLKHTTYVTPVFRNTHNK